ncbi:hypothetical protein JCM1841_002431 [Sporobolomyces salmonicolor]
MTAALDAASTVYSLRKRTHPSIIDWPNSDDDADPPHPARASARRASASASAPPRRPSAADATDDDSSLTSLSDLDHPSSGGTRPDAHDAHDDPSADEDFDLHRSAPSKSHRTKGKSKKPARANASMGKGKQPMRKKGPGTGAVKAKKGVGRANRVHTGGAGALLSSIGGAQVDDAPGVPSAFRTTPPVRPLPSNFVPPPTTVLAILFERKDEVLQAARLEATRDASLQLRSEEAIQTAIECLPTGSQQTALCLAMNRYSAFCALPSVDLPSFPITPNKVSLFLSRCTDTPVGDSFLLAFPQPVSFPLPLANSDDPALTQDEGDRVTQELVRCWIEALGYAQMASSEVWEPLLAPRRAEQDEAEDDIGDAARRRTSGGSLVPLVQDQGIREILSAVETAEHMRLSEQRRVLAVPMGKARVVLAGEAGGRGDEPPQKKTKWIKGGRAVVGPASSTRTTSPSNSRRGSAVNNSACTVDRGATPRPGDHNGASGSTWSSNSDIPFARLNHHQSMLQTLASAPHQTPMAVHRSPVAPLSTSMLQHGAPHHVPPAYAPHLSMQYQSRAYFDPIADTNVQYFDSGPYDPTFANVDFRSTTLPGQAIPFPHTDPSMGYDTQGTHYQRSYSTGYSHPQGGLASLPFAPYSPRALPAQLDTPYRSAPPPPTNYSGSIQSPTSSSSNPFFALCPAPPLEQASLSSLALPPVPTAPKFVVSRHDSLVLPLGKNALAAPDIGEGGTASLEMTIAPSSQAEDQPLVESPAARNDLDAHGVPEIHVGSGAASEATRSGPGPAVDASGQFSQPTVSPLQQLANSAASSSSVPPGDTQHQELTILPPNLPPSVQLSPPRSYPASSYPPAYMPHLHSPQSYHLQRRFSSPQNASNAPPYGYGASLRPRQPHASASAPSYLDLHPEEEYDPHYGTLSSTYPPFRRAPTEDLRLLPAQHAAHFHHHPPEEHHDPSQAARHPLQFSPVAAWKGTNSTSLSVVYPRGAYPTPESPAVEHFVSRSRPTSMQQQQLLLQAYDSAYLAVPTELLAGAGGYGSALEGAAGGAEADEPAALDGMLGLGIDLSGGGGQAFVEEGGTLEGSSWVDGGGVSVAAAGGGEP